MRSHLRLLSALQLIWGAIGLLLGLSTMLLAFAAVAIGVSGSSAGLSAAATAAAFGLASMALLAGGLANVWAGKALRRRLPAGRVATMGLAVPNLFVLPFGTALGIYAYWVLLNDETRQMFLQGGHS